MPRKIKTLFYEPYPFKLYGNTNYLRLVFKLLDRERFTPVLAVPFEGLLTEVICKQGKESIVVDPPESLAIYGGGLLSQTPVNKIKTFLGIVRYTLQMYSLIKKEKFDIIHCNNIRSLLTVGFAAKLNRKKVVLYIKGELTNPFFDVLCFIMADKILFISEFMYKDKYKTFIRLFQKKIEILKIGIDLEMTKKINKATTPVAKDIWIDNGYVNIVYLGVISAEKGLKYLIEGFSKAHLQNKKIRLYLVGNTCNPQQEHFKHELEKIIVSKGLKNNIILTGWRKDPLTVLSLMDIYILTSLSEGVPRSILEAMALGKPVIATNVGGVSSLVENDKTGFLIPPKNVSAIANAIISLAADKELRINFGKNGKTIAEREYSIIDNIKQLEHCYESFLTKDAYLFLSGCKRMA